MRNLTGIALLVSILGTTCASATKSTHHNNHRYNHSVPQQPYSPSQEYTPYGEKPLQPTKPQKQEVQPPSRDFPPADPFFDPVYDPCGGREEDEMIGYHLKLSPMQHRYI